MISLLYLLLVSPLLAAAAVAVTRSQRTHEWANLLGATATLGFGSAAGYAIVTRGPLSAAGGALHADALSALLLLTVSLVAFACAVYSVGYMRNEVAQGNLPARRLRLYYALFHAFVFTMLLVAVSNNLGLLWISMEATTLASAFLVGFYNRTTSLEAAWKYLIIGSVGITLALFGTILVYFSAVHVLGPTSTALDWTTLMRVAAQLDPVVLKIAFVFVLVGYGTKAGLAPMHTWMPDAYSQAPTPAAALISGVLSTCALYGILRFHAIVSIPLGGFSHTLLIFFGLLSLGIATPFVLITKDYKRLLAYSSVEHIGIIALAVGIGTPLALFGAVLHVFNHAVVKCLMFFVAGNLNAKYGTRRIDAVRGALLALPLTGLVLLVGFLAITGSPPFSLFVSEFTILNAMFASGHYVSVGLYLLFLLLIFAGFLASVSQMAFGKPPEGMPRREISRWNTSAMVLLLAFVVVLGVYLPTFMNDLLEQASRILGTVSA